MHIMTHYPLSVIGGEPGTWRRALKYNGLDPSTEPVFLENYITEEESADEALLEKKMLEAMLACGEYGIFVCRGSEALAERVTRCFHYVHRKWLRRTKVIARGTLTPEEQAEKAAAVIARIAATAAFREARTVMLYKAVRGELDPDPITELPEAAGKRFVYPLCTGAHEMEAREPFGEDAWVRGHYGIREPLPEKSALIDPAEIDLVICPCASFDEMRNRMGMGGGYYDRFLPKCVNARIYMAAFEIQKAERVPRDRWDAKPEKVFTERRVYEEKK